MRFSYKMGLIGIAGLMSFQASSASSISDGKSKSSGFTVRDEIAVPEIYGEGAKLYRVSVSPSTTPLLRLVIDRNGVAYVGRLFPEKKCETLVGVSKSEMRCVFGTPFSSTKTTDRFNLTGWCEKWSGKSYEKKWDNFRLEIQYRDDCCYRYVITGPGIAK
ncbi:MAG: hypothetical protein U0105_22565 [Candidatus Obscuribacterales bacterium]